MRTSGSQVLITGGSGFIGTHLCRLLVAQGHKVRVLDLERPKTPVTGAEYSLGDVRDAKAVKDAVAGMDAVFHLAAMVSVPLCQERAVESYETNLLGTARVLEALRDHSRQRGSLGPGRMIFSGSSVVYGDCVGEGEPISESRGFSEPLSFYGAQKQGSEHVARVFHRTEGVPSVIFRFFNVYGPGQDPSSPYSGVISRFASRVARGEKIELNGGGKQTRDFVSVHDVARACAAALELPVERCDASAINLGTGKKTSIHELARMMIEIQRSSSQAVEAPPRVGDIAHSLADIRRANELLRWQPQVELRQGLSELLSEQTG